MKLRLIFARTAYDPQTVWTEIKSVIVDVPDELGEPPECPYHVIGAERLEEEEW